MCSEKPGQGQAHSNELPVPKLMQECPLSFSLRKHSVPSGVQLRECTLGYVLVGSYRDQDVLIRTHYHFFVGTKLARTSLPALPEVRATLWLVPADGV